MRPRPSSSAIVDAILSASREDKLRDGPIQILDLGVGCGVLLLSALHVLAGASSGTGVDIDAGAIEAFQRNTRANLSEDHASRVNAVTADFSKLDCPTVRPHLSANGYDVVVCNPPYRSEEQQEAYERSVGAFGGYKEHTKTLVGGKTGLEMYEAVAACLTRDIVNCRDAAAVGEGVSSILKPSGTLIFQVEAGARGVAGGMAAKVAKAVETAAQGRLELRSVHNDEKGLERAILLKQRPP